MLSILLGILLFVVLYFYITDTIRLLTQSIRATGRMILILISIISIITLYFYFN